MTKKVFALDTQPGIQRDGTIFDKNYYNSGRWVRFQRGRPRKIYGYKEIINNLAGPSRGIYVLPANSFTAIFNGYSDGMQRLLIDEEAHGSGLLDFTLAGFTPNANNLWQFDSLFDASGGNDEVLVAHPGQNLASIDNTVNTPVLFGSTSTLSMTPIGVFALSATLASSTTVTVASTTQIGAGQAVSGTGIPTGATVASVTDSTHFELSIAATTTGASTLTFDNQVDVSGGVVVLHPYVFVYGNNGLLKNCAAGNPQDWVSADANETNVASTKIVKGLPVRGGSNAPSGLFWALDSLIRVSYNPTTITVGGTPQTFYWRYDLISSQSSILASNSVIEYDGVYYWIGVDRFLMYNGVVKEIPNSMNQNYFFDNLNYAQRQKVYATKVPRFGEIWWFFPSGTSEECNDCIIYNIRENCWYDTGQALGARRSAGYFSQVFHYPINADWEINAANGVNAITLTSGGTLYTDGTYIAQALTGGTGSGATADIVVVGGIVTTVTIVNRGTGYTAGDVLSASLPVGSGFEITVDTLMNFVSLWQHEIGTNAVQGVSFNAIESYFETNDLGWVSGGPSQPSPIGENRWLRLERVEPDFVQVGEMELYITGRPFAQSEDQTTGPYTFNPDTNKIDMKEQRREMRLKFVSNVADGDYQLGKVLLNADIGDVRGY